MLPLRTREALIRPIILPIMPHMLKEFEITFFVEPSTLAFSMAKPVLKPNWQSLCYPLQTDVGGYVAATGSVVFVGLLMVCLLLSWLFLYTFITSLTFILATDLIYID